MGYAIGLLVSFAVAVILMTKSECMFFERETVVLYKDEQYHQHRKRRQMTQTNWSFGSGRFAGNI